MTRAEHAAEVYERRVALIRRLLDPASPAFARAMTEACSEYEHAMVADIGEVAAGKLGAGMPVLGLAPGETTMLEPFCACGRVFSRCDGSRRGCGKAVLS